ncbi:L,D-transpeptidase [bacterium]|nr:L,D-transpeptidase [bacterium]
MKTVFLNTLNLFKKIVFLKWQKIALAAVLFVLLLVEGSVHYLGGWREPYSVMAEDLVLNGSKVHSRLLTKNNTLKKRLVVKQPKSPYLIVDTAQNKLVLKNKDIIMLEAIISSGSGNILDDPTGVKQWVFDTPRGEFMINSKLVAPVWKKPDWAFVEEGEQIPLNEKDRMEIGAMGDYAMGFGGGYFIHGTLYTRLLGRNVTHGCIRVGDPQLKSIYETVHIGTQLYIF